MTGQNAQAWAYAAKTTLAALMALWVSLWVGLPMPFWAMTTTFIVSSPLSGATRSKAIYRVFGTVIGAAVAVAMVPALVEWPELLCAGLALWVGGCLAVSLLDRSPRAYVMMLAGYTATLIAFPSVNAPETVFDVASARVTEIVLGITCSTLTHSLLWPKSVASALSPRLHGWLADARTWRQDIVSGAGADTNQRDRRKLAVDAVDCTLLATHIPFDTSHWREATASVQALLRRYLLLLPVLSGLADRQNALSHPGPAEQTSHDHRWEDLLRESYDLRLAQADTLLEECEELLVHLEDPRIPAPATAHDRLGSITLHADPGAALASGFSAALAIMMTCALWIGSGWPDGASAAAMTGVICCLFATLDNPVPAMVAFGASLIAGIPLAGLYLFAILPKIDGFPLLAMVLAFPMMLAGRLMSIPKLTLPAVACVMGFCSALALQETYSADFSRFLNNNLGQVVAVIFAAGVTAGLRTVGKDTAIARLNRRLGANLVRMASSSTPPDPLVALGRSTDQLALISQRLGDDTADATTGLTEVRIAMNIMTVQHLRAQASDRLRAALSDMLAHTARWYGKATRNGPPPHEFLASIDTALALAIDEPPLAITRASGMVPPVPEQGRAALVALRRNLFPDAPAFMAGEPA